MRMFGLVTIQQLRQLSDEQIIAEINELIVPPLEPLNFRPADVVAAQFYMAELDRREKRRADEERDKNETERWKTDLKYERWIVVLIIFEVLVSIVLFTVGGCQQSREVNAQIEAIGKVKDELKELETSSKATATTLGQVNDSLGLMNKKIQEQLNLEYEPSILVSSVQQAPSVDVLKVHNYGHTSLRVSGVRIGADTCQQTDPVTISGGTDGTVGGNVVYAGIRRIIGAGAALNSVLYLKGEDGKEYEADLHIEAESQTIGSGVKVHTNGIRSANWTRELEKAKPCYGVP